MRNERKQPKQKFKVICAWCGKHKSGDPKAKLISHGMCKACADKIKLERLKEIK